MKALLTIIIIFLPMICFSQQVIFCEQVDSYGNALSPSNEFKVGPKGGFFKILVKMDKEIDAKNAVFDVYMVKDNKETFDNSLRMEVKPGLSWFYKEITFFKPGEYHVYVYDDKDQLLGVGKVNILIKN